jgi:hypothetical protein
MSPPFLFLGKKNMLPPLAWSVSAQAEGYSRVAGLCSGLHSNSPTPLLSLVVSLLVGIAGDPLRESCHSCVTLLCLSSGSRPLEVWWITVVYGPLLDHEKSEFLAELLRLRDGNDEAWLVCGDFNMIYLGGRRRESSCRRSFAADSTLLSSSRAGCFGRRGMQGRSIASHRRRRSWERPSGLRL